MKKNALRLATLAASLTLVASALADVQLFVGRDGDWFNARNWSRGHVPGRGDSVVIGDGQRVVVDPPTGTTTITLENVMVSSFGSLETKPGVRWITGNEIVYGNLIHRSADASLDLAGVGAYLTGGVGTGGGVFLNPTPKQKRIVVLQSSITVGLGGTEAAGLGKVGRGYYANLRAETAIVSGGLDAMPMYGFVPRAGDTFTILRADRIVGQYRGLPEGAMVKRTGKIGLFIHYTTREHILLARQVG